MRTNDPIGRMFKRGQLRRETDRDGKAAEARLKAARMWQSIYADLPGAQLNSDKRKAAQAMSRLQDQLGEYRSLLLRRVLGEKLELDAVASVMLGIAVPADHGAQLVFANVLLANFLNSLDALAGHFGSKPIRGPRGPQREGNRSPSGSFIQEGPAQADLAAPSGGHVVRHSGRHG
jgi:hypothetical protein